jgi:predicted HTH transcriptional regulator
MLFNLGVRVKIEALASNKPHAWKTEHALRREFRLYPEVSARKLVANALIH